MRGLISFLISRPLAQIKQTQRSVGIVDVQRTKLAVAVILQDTVVSFVNTKIGSFIIKFAA